MTDDNERIDPYQLVFGAESIDDRLFPPIEEEARARGQPVDDPDRFLFLSSVGQLLQAIAGQEPYGGEREGASGPPDEDGSDGALRQYGRLLYHAFHFWRGGGSRVEVREDRLRWLLDEVTTVRDWRLRPPARTGYLRLPRNLVWAAPAPGLQPEPADGFFWSFIEPEAAPAELHVLLTLGVRPDRPGFSVVPATGVLDDVDHWADTDARPDGADFETTLPGGEMDRLYSVENAAELLKLASLCFWELDPASG
jgi:hypothetical protein